jgi:alpha-ribazole phosphatase
MRLILVRHGETDANRLRQYVGRTDVLLNEVGREQAKKAAQQVANLNLYVPQVRNLGSLPHLTIHKAIHSPYERTTETAVLIMRHLTNGDELRTDFWATDNRLAELHFGDWEGLTYEQAEQQDRGRLWAWYDDPWNTTPPNGESLRELARRVAGWVAEIVGDADWQQKTLLIVSHGGPLRWFLAEYVLRDREQFHALKWEPGQVVVCSHEAGVWTLEEREVQRQ